MHPRRPFDRQTDPNVTVVSWTARFLASLTFLLGDDRPIPDDLVRHYVANRINYAGPESAALAAVDSAALELPPPLPPQPSPPEPAALPQPIPDADLTPGTPPADPGERTDAGGREGPA